MKVRTTQFMRMVKHECGSLKLFCIEFGMDRTELMTILLLGLPFDYEQSERMIRAFGAKKMARVIDWEGMNVRCPI